MVRVSGFSIPAQFAFVVVLVAPLCLPEFYTFLATELVIWGMLAISLDLLLGYTGLPSFGHAVFFGVPAYALGIILARGGSLPLAILGAAVALLMIAVVVGYFATKTGGHGYIIITLLVSFSLYILTFVLTDLTGGENGLFIASENSMAPWPAWLRYVVVASIGVAVWLATRKLVRSGFGLVLLGIKANERRVQALGYDCEKYKFRITLISAAIAGLAGVLYALLVRNLSADLMGPELSTEIVIWVLLGGVQTLLGPVLGAALFISLKQVLNNVHAYPILLGLLFVFMVTWVPAGLASLRLGKR
jgi:branched-chain amino acid transport system permease protein